MSILNQNDDTFNENTQLNQVNINHLNANANQSNINVISSNNDNEIDLKYDDEIDDLSQDLKFVNSVQNYKN